MKDMTINFLFNNCLHLNLYVGDMSAFIICMANTQSTLKASYNNTSHKEAELTLATFCPVQGTSEKKTGAPQHVTASSLDFFFLQGLKILL